jgi:hypothetical protein
VSRAPWTGTSLSQLIFLSFEQGIKLSLINNASIWLCHPGAKQQTTTVNGCCAAVVFFIVGAKY